VDRRGDVIPVIELRSLLGLSAHEHTLETPLMFCRVGARDVCLVVDAVDDVLEVPAGALMPPSELLDASNCMLGSLRHPDGLVLVLDIERLLSALPLKASAPSGGERL
jgi:purine-binding chemotaxis protein CheW